MSLLLDALNRASKDKAAAVAAEASAPPKLDDPSTGSPLTKGDTPAAAAAAAAAGSSPSQTPMVLELSLENEAIAPAPVDAWHTEQSVALPAATVLDLAAPTQARPAPTPSMPPPPPVQAPIPSASPAGRDTKPASAKAAADAPRVAREIVRAKAATSRTGPPMRLLILGALTVLSAAALGSMLLGWWGDPSAWLRAGPAPRPVVVAPTATPRGVEPVGVEPAQPQPVELPASAASVAQPPPTAPRAWRPPAVQGPAAQPSVPVVAAAPPASPGPRQAPSANAPRSGQALVQSRRVGPTPLELGYAALVEGRLPAAAQAYGQALLANPEERDALLGLAYVAHQQGRSEEARGYYQRVLRQDPGNPIARSGLLAASAADDPQLVASRSREVAEQNPDSAAAQATLGHAMVREGRLAEAQQAFFRAHSLEPSVAQHAFNLAVALDRLRNFGPARQYYERALTLSAQSGGERASGVPQAVVQTRLDQLRAATVGNPVGAARE